jgi:hypothetical protein
VAQSLLNQFPYPLTSLIKLLNLRPHMLNLFDLRLLLTGHSLDILRHVKLLQLLVVMALASEIERKKRLEKNSSGHMLKTKVY